MVRNAFLILATTAALTPVAFANNFVGGEIGYDTPRATSSLTRAQVQSEYHAFRSHPVLWDGTVVIQGELGQVSSHQGAFMDSKPGPHSHVLGNSGTAKGAPAVLSDAERRAQQQQYLN